MEILILLVIAGAIAYFVTHKKAAEPNIPVPTTLRTDLLFGYYGSYPAYPGIPSQLDETVDHINLFFASRWYGPDSQLDQMSKATHAGIPIMLDMPEPYQIDYNINIPFDIVAAEIRVRNRFQQLQQANILQNIIAIYPVDEPELFGWTAEQVIDTNAMIRRVLSEFNHTAKIAIFYTASWKWTGVQSFDWVGFDNYGPGAKIFTNGDYEKLLAVLRPDQQTMLIPGGCDIWHEHPAQWFNKAQQDTRVAVLMPFVWRDNTDPEQDATIGIRSNGLAEEYRAVGLKIKNPQNA